VYFSYAAANRGAVRGYSKKIDKKFFPGVALGFLVFGGNILTDFLHN
jgi:hypothetical protein